MRGAKDHGSGVANIKGDFILTATASSLISLISLAMFLGRYGWINLGVISVNNVGGDVVDIFLRLTPKKCCRK